MNKIERLVVGGLFCLLIVWSFYGRKLMPQPPPTPVAATNQVAAAGSSTNTASGAPAAISQNTASNQTAAVAATPETPAEAEPIHQKPEKVVTITNSVLSVAFSSWGGGIARAELIEREGDRLKYPAVNKNESGPVVLDFAKRPALTYNGISGLGALNDFEVKPAQNGVEVLGKAANGLSLSRKASLTNEYVLTVTDVIKNDSNQPVTVPEYSLNTGPMSKIESHSRSRGISYLGVESRNLEDGKVTRWDKDLKGLFGVKGGCSRADLTNVPLAQEMNLSQPTEWVAVKNKFFTQVLMPEKGSEGSSFFAERANEMRYKLIGVAAAMKFDSKVLAPNESITRTTRYYVGPKQYSRMKALGGKQDRIILRNWPGFGWWRWACAGLLWLLNALNAITHNYGVAIILLTVIVKIVFWPVTHKGTESMKKMKNIQPEVAKLREKYKNDPRKLQEKQMLLYRQHGVNPVAGCLPMVIQMPVFIALFTVLRSAVELRFQSFLWISDLCEPEGLLQGVLPFPAGGLNILPILMTITTMIQQRLTPTAGDPQQQKMMAFMPIMMLFIFYNMASALVLYWTVSQLLSILQVVLQNRKDKLKTA
jgi:YidC/Oxa1 family membrane protein insertase